VIAYADEGDDRQKANALVAVSMINRLNQ